MSVGPHLQPSMAHSCPLCSTKKKSLIRLEIPALTESQKSEYMANPASSANDHAAQFILFRYIFKMESSTIILIGPEGAGKSTIGALLATSLAKPLYSLDRHRDALYAPHGYSHAVAQSIHDTHGLWAFYAHWTLFEFQAVCHILGNAARQPDEFFGRILDFGAGHSVYDNPEELAAVEALMAPFAHVFLILPCEDVDEAARIMEGRRGKELGLNRHFLTHESNRRLAKYTIYTKDRTPEECAEEILQILRRGSQSGEEEEASLSTVV